MFDLGFNLAQHSLCFAYSLPLLRNPPDGEATQPRGLCYTARPSGISPTWHQPWLWGGDQRAGSGRRVDEGLVECAGALARQDARRQARDRLDQGHQGFDLGRHAAGDVGGVGAADVTGGMASKVEAVMALVETVPGLSARILSGERPGALLTTLVDPSAAGGTVISSA